MTKKLFFSSILLSLSALFIGAYMFFMHPVQPVYAAQTTAFKVEVSPSTIGINQTFDVTIRAVDANGTVTKDYVNQVFIDIPDLQDYQDLVAPADYALYQFLPEDQGVRVFSKGFSIKTPGTYTLEVQDLQNDTIMGKVQFVVTEKPVDIPTNNKITFSSPLANAVETNAVVSIIGNTDVKNAKVQIFLDEIKVTEEQVSANGDFASFLSDVTVGQHTLQAKVYDINNTVLAQSDVIDFTYQPTQGGGINQFDVLPSKTLKQGQKATFSAKVANDVSSFEITLTDGNAKVTKLMLDKTAPGVFEKQLLMDTVGAYTVDAQFVNSSETKRVSGVASLTVLEGKGIKEVSYLVDPIDKTKLQVSWKSIGSFDYGLVKYGTGKDELLQSVVLSGSSGSVVGLDIASNDYYVRVFPSDMSGSILGEPSDIILIEQVQGSAPVCRVNGITITTKKIGDQYFLTWNAAENAERYIVYRSDKQVSSVADMQKVGETSDTKFPYPFDPEAKSDAYAYYAVVAVCQDGSALQIDNTKKVKVGPETSLIIVLLLSLMIFGVYKMRREA